MYLLMSRYYAGINEAQFREDLAKKSVVFLLESEGRIYGFSSLLYSPLEVQGVRITAAYSGDTVLDRQFWGTRELGKVFLRHLWLHKMRDPFTPLYWFLMSKGYKTYLLMANNFSDYYPRPRADIPGFEKALMDAFYAGLYPAQYRDGLIRFEEAPCKLKQGVADIDAALLESNEKVALFQRLNPDWKNGTELACVARMTLSMPFFYGTKALIKKFLASRPLQVEDGKGGVSVNAAGTPRPAPAARGEA